MLALCTMLAGTVVAVWQFMGLILLIGETKAPKLCLNIFMWLKPLYLPAILVTFITGHLLSHRPLSFWNTIIYALQLLSWVLYKDQGDDRWKKLRKKAKEKIIQKGSRLVVVPDPA